MEALVIIAIYIIWVVAHNLYKSYMDKERDQLNRYLFYTQKLLYILHNLNVNKPIYSGLCDMAKSNLYTDENYLISNFEREHKSYMKWLRSYFMQFMNSQGYTPSTNQIGKFWFPKLSYDNVDIEFGRTSRIQFLEKILKENEVPYSIAVISRILQERQHPYS